MSEDPAAEDDDREEGESPREGAIDEGIGPDEGETAPKAFETAENRAPETVRSQTGDPPEPDGAAGDGRPFAAEGSHPDGEGTGRSAEATSSVDAGREATAKRGEADRSITWSDRLWTIVALIAVGGIAGLALQPLEALGWSLLVGSIVVGAVIVSELALRLGGPRVVEPIWRGMLVAIFAAFLALAGLRIGDVHTPTRAWALQLASVAVGIAVAVGGIVMERT